MKLSGRQKELLDIIGEAGYVSVEELAKKTFTSPSSIRRDLANMQNLGLVKRSHGGVSLPERNGRVAGFYNRSQKNVKEKRLIAAKAAALLKNGQSILLDSSSTASFLLPHIAKLEGATVFTNNLETAVSEIQDDGVMVKDKNGMAYKIAADSVILSVGYKPAPIAEKAKNIHIIGDADKVGNLRSVIWGAWDVCMKL